MYDSGLVPCDGGIQFQHLHYKPQNKDDGKELSCSLDEDYDGNTDYPPSSVRLHVNQKYFENPVNINYQKSIKPEELAVEFRDVWGEAHVRSGKG